MAPSPLRLRMQQIMRVRNYSERTQKIYLGAVAKFAAFFHRSPEKLGSEEIQLVRHPTLVRSAVTRQLCEAVFCEVCAAPDFPSIRGSHRIAPSIKPRRSSCLFTLELRDSPSFRASPTFPAPVSLLYKPHGVAASSNVSVYRIKSLKLHELARARFENGRLAHAICNQNH